MEILKLLQERHTTKKYDASRKISDADFDLLLESLRLAPSSVNSQPWEFFIADTKEAKEKLLPAIADFNHSRVTDSDRLIVCAIHTDLDESYMQELDEIRKKPTAATKIRPTKLTTVNVAASSSANIAMPAKSRVGPENNPTSLRAFCFTRLLLSAFSQRRSKAGTLTRLMKSSACAKKACMPSMPSHSAMAHPTTIMPLARSPVGRHNASSTNFNAIRTSAQQSHAGRSSRFVPTCIFVN